MELATFDAVQSAFAAAGPAAAADALCDRLRAAGDHHALFYATLLKSRVALGVSPFPTGPATDLPAETHAAYEDAIRTAGRTVGGMLLEQGDLPRAWGYFRLIGEPGPVKDALAAYTPPADADIYPLIEIAWQHGLAPEKGFDLMLSRNGVCSAITMVHSTDMTANPALRESCTRKLIRALSDQLSERLTADLTARGIAVPPGADPVALLESHPDVMTDDAYHVDVSHLSAVVQLALHLPPGPDDDLKLAVRLADYGRRLAPAFRGSDDPPFEDTYADYRVYLNALAGVDVESGIAHFREKAERAVADGHSGPAEVLVNLFLKLDRPAEAFAAGTKYLPADAGELACPGVIELARRAGDFGAVTAAAKENGDAVTYLAGLIAGRGR